ncbi:heterotrimeric G protein alpha subunit [Fimicolochytrium jonesii]|uniref:heterotrimeric G protein alpha subunit n=1 Tax=Fimicolochytrium jonesii TaxID=1396493 RepID=UPI0022FDDA89|nr:heterotrimeric G protein alpha subunit [Fimicolochytrium jonesii]KAI8826749.1 heterotrimeric G protein alpha subunit [Fimicolochytrium jonesii]
MGICTSKEEEVPTEASMAIDRGIEEHSKRLKKECKILLLGGGESGKSTIVKQMKIIHQDGYTRDELMTFQGPIFKNVLDSIQALVAAISTFELKYESPEVQAMADKVAALGSDYKLDSEIADAIFAIARDPAAVTALERSNEFYIIDSASYFFAEVKRIGAEDYCPTEQDVLRARVKTTGITETRFNMGQLSIHMFDVGGQRSERRKWIHCFEAVTSIIFCVALSEYDQVLLEESQQNRMAESLILFESVINSRWFLRTSIILFLNKIDLFKIKLARNPLEKYFPEYKGGPDVNKAAKFILWRFTQTNRARLNIYPHLTQATDTSNIRLVFAAVKVTILQNALKDSGIM